jgi:hypothetical protein
VQDVHGQPYEQLKILSGIFDHPPRATLKKLQSDWSALQNIGALPDVQNYIQLWQSLYQQCVDWNLVLPQGRENSFLRERAFFESWYLQMSRPRRIGKSSLFSPGSTVLFSHWFMLRDRLAIFGQDKSTNGCSQSFHNIDQNIQKISVGVSPIYNSNQQKLKLN